MEKSKGIKYDNCKDCNSKCNHAGKDREFVCPKGISCKVKKETPMTNADRVRAMSDEELSMFLAEVENRRSVSGGGAVWKGITNTFLWLRQPAEVVE